MDIGVITVKGCSYHPNQRLREAAHNRGLVLECLNPYDLGSGIHAGRLTLQIGEHRKPPGVILPRQGAQIGNSSLTLLAQVQALGIPLVNEPEPIRIASNKFSTLQVLAAAGIPVPDTRFAHSPSAFWDGIESLGGYPLVGKGLNSRQGQEVELLNGPQDAKRFMETRLKADKGVLLQRFISPKGRRDFRVLVIGGKVAGTMELQAFDGDFRSNYHVSGWSHRAHLSMEQEGIALASVRAVGLSIAGVDLVLDEGQGCLVLEVNSTPGFRGLEAATGLDIAGTIIAHAAGLIRAAEDTADGVYAH